MTRTCQRFAGLAVHSTRCLKALSMAERRRFRCLPERTLVLLPLEIDRVIPAIHLVIICSHVLKQVFFPLISV